MSTDRSTARSRREVLAVAAGGVAGLAAASLGRTGAAQAATGDPIIAGAANTASAVTTLAIAPASPDNLVDALAVTSSGLGTAVAAATDRGSGLLGVSGSTDIGPYHSSDIGVSGRAVHLQAVAGVAGDSDTGAGVIGTSGVLGVAGAAGVVGVVASSFDQTGTALLASNGYPLPTPFPSTAVHAQRSLSAGGFAVFVDGRMKMRLSGRASIRAGRRSTKLTVTGLTSSMMAFAVLQSNRSGTWVQAAIPTTGYLTIVLNRTLATRATVAWMVIG